MLFLISDASCLNEDHRSFEPSRVNRPWIIEDPQVLEALNLLSRQIGRLEESSRAGCPPRIGVQGNRTEDLMMSSDATQSGNGIPINRK